MTRTPAALILGLVLALGIAACGNDSTPVRSASGTNATTSTTDSSAGASTSAPMNSDSASTVKLTSSPLGKILTTGDGMTLYLFTPDTGTKSTCTGGCARAWPALKGPATGDGVEADDLGTTTRDDGSTQVTFYGHPVYTYAGDSAPGDVSGQGTGGKWYVIDADGNAVKTSADATPSTVNAGGGGY
jgi:predicted lipoprotein with Yx(FWY)xxD motif